MAFGRKADPPERGPALDSGRHSWTFDYQHSFQIRAVQTLRGGKRFGR